MNIVGTLCFLGGVSYFISLLVGINYDSWNYPEYHKTERNWLIGLFIFGTTCFSIAILIGTK